MSAASEVSSLGQFACPSRQLLKGAKGIHFQSEAEAMEKSDCEENLGGHWAKGEFEKDG